MVFEGQVPLQIRRSGKMNKEGVHLTMTQWFPKLSEYDFEGWHPNPYIGREFHGVWGNYAVNITIDKNYVIGGTGTLLNADEIGHGYSEDPKNKKGQTLTWRFLAKNVHEAFKLSLVFVLPFFGTAQLIISYFMYSEFKYNVFILLWLLMLIIQVILVAVSSFIKPRP